MQRTWGQGRCCQVADPCFSSPGAQSPGRLLKCRLQGPLLVFLTGRSGVGPDRGLNAQFAGDAGTRFENRCCSPRAPSSALTRGGSVGGFYPERQDPA